MLAIELITRDKFALVVLVTAGLGVIALVLIGIVDIVKAFRNGGTPPETLLSIHAPVIAQKAMDFTEIVERHLLGDADVDHADEAEVIQAMYELRGLIKAATGEEA